jgi:hypothetical protein
VIKRASSVAFIFLLATFAISTKAQNRRPARALPQINQEFISVDAPVVVLEHVKVIDGTGAAAVEDQTIVIDKGVIQSIGPTGSTSAPSGAKVLDLTGHSVIPGLVGMHEHMFYPGATGQGRIPGAPEMYPDMAFSFPRLYLAAGVTSIRTAEAWNLIQTWRLRITLTKAAFLGQRCISPGLTSKARVSTSRSCTH